MKKSIKQTLALFTLDWRRIRQNKLTLLLVIALMVIPSLYAWFNIAALWDPYANTKDIAIAVYSEDQTVNVLEKDINIGDKIVANLKENKTVGWRFVSSKEELDKGVKSGKYYGGIFLPENFSKNLISFIDGDLTKPEIEYSVNQKINAIAPKITDKGAGTIKDTISKEFIGTVSETLLSVFNDVGYDLDANLASINKLTSKVLLIDDNLEKIDEYTSEVVTLNDKFPEYKEKLLKANELIDYLPEVDKIGEKVIEMNEMMPKITESGKLILTLQEKIPEIENAGRQIKLIDEDFDGLVSVMTDAIGEANKGIEIISKAQKVLPDVARLAETANQVIPEIATSLGEVEKALPQIANGIGTGAQVISVIAQDVAVSAQKIADLITSHELSAAQKSELKELLTNLSVSLESLNGMIESTTGMLAEIQELTGSQQLSQLIASLTEVQQRIFSIEGIIADVLANGDSWSPTDLAQQLQKISQEASGIAENLKVITPESIQNKVAPLLVALEEMLQSAQNITSQVVDQELIAQLDTLLTKTTQTVTQAVTFLEKYEKELPAVKEEVHSANLLLNDNMPTLISGINKAADIYQNELPVIATKLNTAANFVEKDWPTIEGDLTKTLGMVNQKLPKVEEALSLATTMIQEDWPSIRASIHRGADLIRKGQKDVDLPEIVKLLKSDANAESDFIANPVLVNQTDVYPVPNNGSASAPFYTALCLWVGAVLFSSIASTEFQLSAEDQKKYSKKQQFLARMGTFLVVGFFQALIVSIGNHFLLGTYAVNPVLSILFTLLVGFTFMMMVYVLVAIFGNLGKGAAVIILVLSISAGGGNYPIEMSGKFFQVINPFLPFTYAVNLLREPVGGIYWPNAWKGIIILSLIAVGFFLLGIVLYPRIRWFFKKLNDQLHEGKILH